MDYFKYLLLRYPILPIDSVNNEFYDKEIIFNKMHISQENIMAIKKYTERMKYRTAPLHGMVNESKVIIGDKTELVINDLTCSFVKFAPEDSYLINKRVDLHQDFLIYEYKDDTYELEINSTIKYLLSKYSRKVKTEKEWIDLISSNTKEAAVIFFELVKYGFFIQKNSLTIESEKCNKFNYKKAILQRLSEKEYQISFSDKILRKVGNVVKRLLSNCYPKNMEDLTDYFYEKYSNALVSATQVILSDEFDGMIQNIEVVYRQELNTFFYEYISEALWTEDYQCIKISSTDIPLNNNDKYFYDRFDVFINIYDIDGQTMINLDTGKPIVNYADANKFVKPDSYSLNIISDNPVINFMLNSNVNSNNSRINMDYCTERGTEIDNLAVKLDEKNKKFSIFDITSQRRIIINKNCNVSRNWLNHTSNRLLFFSDCNNLLGILPFNTSMFKFKYVPRIIIDNTIILSREQWFIEYNSRLHKNKSIFKNFLLKLIMSKTNLKPLCYVEDDYEIIISLNNRDDINFLYKNLKLKGFLILKEDLSEYSFLKIDGYTYNNEIIISFNENDTSYNGNERTTCFVQGLDIDFLDEWVFFEVVIKRVSKWIFKTLFQLKKEINMDSFFYLFYIENEEQLLRIRIKNKSKVFLVSSLLKQSSLLGEVRIKEYTKETARYKNMTMNIFESISCLDSKRILNYYSRNKKELELVFESDHNKQKIMIFNTLYLLEVYNKDFEDVLGVFNKNELDRSKSKRFNAMIRRSFAFVQSGEIAIDFQYRQSITQITKLLTSKEVRDMIHLSNIRLVGNDLELEQEIYKHIYIFYKEMTFKDEYNR